MIYTLTTVKTKKELFSEITKGVSKNLMLAYEEPKHNLEQFRRLSFITPSQIFEQEDTKSVIEFLSVELKQYFSLLKIEFEAFAFIKSSAMDDEYFLAVKLLSRRST